MTVPPQTMEVILTLDATVIIISTVGPRGYVLLAYPRSEVHQIPIPSDPTQHHVATSVSDSIIMIEI